MPGIRSISAVTFATPDMARAVRFYKALGFSIAYGGETGAFASFRVGKGSLNLARADGHPPSTDAVRVIFHVDNVDVMYARVLARGFAAEMSPRDAAWGERYFHMKDPDGHALSFAHPIESPSLEAPGRGADFARRPQVIKRRAYHVSVAPEAGGRTLIDALAQYARDGFTERLSVVGDRLRGDAAQTALRTEDIVIRDYQRFEGVSDPDDMAIVYAIEARSGVRGTLVDAYGVYSDPIVSAFLGPVPIWRDRDQSASPAGPDLTAGILIDSLEEGVPLLGHVESVSVILVRRGSDVFAIGATCTHYGGPLAEGLVVGPTVRCPWHHACFDLRTGRALRAPALNPVAAYEVIRRQDAVVVVRSREKRASAPARPSCTEAASSVAIVGAGAAGNSAAEELRHLGFEGAITLFDADEAAPYDRPNLSKDYLAGTAPEDWLPRHPRSHYKELAVELILGRRVIELDSAAKRLTLDDGTSRRFGAVVLATGADPVRLGIPGADGPPIHYLRSLADSRRIIAGTEGARRAVVLGAGFIGLEVAASLRARGLDVHVVAPGTRPLERVLGAELGDFIRTLHEANGVVFHLGQTARGMERRHVVLQNGERLEADLVVAGVGVGPAVRLAQSAGLVVDHGVVVDRYLETSAKGIFAIGDVARWPDPRSNANVRVEHWVLAQRQGQAVARVIAGDRRPFMDIPFFWSQHYDVSINYVGHAARWDSIEIDGSLQRRDCSVRYRTGGKVLAMASLFRGRESLEVELAMEQEVAP